MLRSAVLVCLLILGVGCNEGTHTAPATSVAGPPVNTMCPIMDGKVGEITEDTPMVTWNGKTIAFCCAPCVPKWNELSEEEKEAKLAPAMSQETSEASDGSEGSLEPLDPPVENDPAEPVLEQSAR